MSEFENNEDRPNLDPVVRNVDERVRKAALALLEADRNFDDSIFTPPGANSLCIDPETPPSE
jgi:hypothetical protein